MLKTRQGALPAVIAAPMTSSEVLPAGISCAVTFSVGCAAFHSSTIALPQAISSGLFESQTLIGPFALAASLEPAEPPPPHAGVRPSARTPTDHGQESSLSSASPFVRAPGWSVVVVRARHRRARETGPVDARTTSAAGGSSTGVAGAVVDELEQARGRGAAPGDASVPTVVSAGWRWAAISVSSKPVIES